MEELFQRMADVETENRRLNTAVADLTSKFSETQALMRQIHEDLSAIKEQVATISTIVTTWNNIRGFVETVKAINRTLWFVIKIAAFLGALGWAIYMLGKTGHWIWPLDTGSD